MLFCEWEKATHLPITESTSLKCTVMMVINIILNGQIETPVYRCSNWRCTQHSTLDTFEKIKFNAHMMRQIIIENDFRSVHLTEKKGFIHWLLDENVEKMMRKMNECIAMAIEEKSSNYISFENSNNIDSKWTIQSILLFHSLECWRENISFYIPIQCSTLRTNYVIQYCPTKNINSLFFSCSFSDDSITCITIELTVSCMRPWLNGNEILINWEDPRFNTNFSHSFFYFFFYQFPFRFGNGSQILAIPHV